MSLCSHWLFISIGKSDLVIYLIRFPRKTVHEFPIFGGATFAAEGFSNLIALKILHALRFFSFLAHRYPADIYCEHSVAFILANTNQVSVTTTSAPLTASRGSALHDILSAHSNCLTRSHTVSGHWYLESSGVATRTLCPNRG